MLTAAYVWRECPLRAIPVVTPGETSLAQGAHGATRSPPRLLGWPTPEALRQWAAA